MYTKRHRFGPLCQLKKLTLKPKEVAYNETLTNDFPHFNPGKQQNLRRTLENIQLIKGMQLTIC
jgi:hypothetical protein